MGTRVETNLLISPSPPFHMLRRVHSALSDLPSTCLFRYSSARGTFCIAATLRRSGNGNCRLLFFFGPFSQPDHVSGGRRLAKAADALFEQFDSSPPRPTPPAGIELIRFENNRLSEADGNGSGPWHEFSLCQNVASTLDMRGHDGHPKVGRKQPSTLLECLDLAVT